MFSTLAPKAEAQAPTLETLWQFPVADILEWGVFSADVGDVNGDGLLDVAILPLHWPSGPGTVQVIKNDGTPLWSTSIAFAGRGIALEDTDLDGRDELYVFGTTGSPPHFGDPMIHCFDEGGSFLWEFTIHETAPWSRSISYVTFMNLDLDPQLEIFGIGMGWADYVNYALDTDGTLLWKFTTNDIGSDLALGDLNNDGQDEFVLFSFREIYILDKSGNLLKSIQPHSGSHNAYGALGDITGDGVDDIVVSYNAYDHSSFLNTLYAYRNDGTLLWQKNYPQNVDGMNENPILIDVTNDGVKDVVLYAHRAIHAYRNDGFPVWTFGNATLFSTITDPHLFQMTSFDILQGDSKDEIIFQLGQELYVLSLDGSFVQKFAIPNQGTIVGSGHIGKDPRVDNRFYETGDINNDGINEFVMNVIINNQRYVAVMMVPASAPILPVGGFWVPINRFQMLAPLIGWASLVTIFAAIFVGVKRAKKRQN
jgi:outer membrane protein assembly factor BamB